MAAGSSGIMIDALVWHLGLLLLFGSCLDKQYIRPATLVETKGSSLASTSPCSHGRVKELGTFVSPLLAEFSTGLR